MLRHVLQEKEQPRLISKIESIKSSKPVTQAAEITFLQMLQAHKLKQFRVRFSVSGAFWRYSGRRLGRKEAEERAQENQMPPELPVWLASLYVIQKLPER
jgi:hypothetical protein